MMPVNKKLRRLTREDVNFFHENGYLHVKSVISDQVLERSKLPLQRWVERVINGWVKKGLITDKFSDLPFDQRLHAAWLAAKRPPFKDNLMREVASKEIVDILRNPTLIDIASDLMGSENILSLGTLCRPKLPNKSYDFNTPWHQDAQYRDNSASAAAFVVMWMPFMDVSEENSCLEFAAGHHKKGILYDSYIEGGGLCSIYPKDYATFTNLVAVPIKRGDIVCIHRLVPHRALPNKSDRMRWSLDMRFSDIDDMDRLHITPPCGFISANADPAKIQRDDDACYQALWHD